MAWNMPERVSQEAAGVAQVLFQLEFIKGDEVGGD